MCGHLLNFTEVLVLAFCHRWPYANDLLAYVAFWYYFIAGIFSEVINWLRGKIRRNVLGVP